jgi:anti-sigma B factor antagonist
MKIKRQDYAQVTVIEMSGELDKDSAEQLLGMVDNVAIKSSGGIVLDMNGVTFIDSFGLEKLLGAKDRCKEYNCELRMAGLDEICNKIMELTRLNDEFDTYEELSEAVKSFA